MHEMPLTWAVGPRDKNRVGMHDDGKQKEVKKLTRIRGRKPLTVGYPDFLTCFAKGRERSSGRVELLWLACYRFLKISKE